VRELQGALKYLDGALTSCKDPRILLILRERSRITRLRRLHALDCVSDLFRRLHEPSAVKGGARFLPTRTVLRLRVHTLCAIHGLAIEKRSEDHELLHNVSDEPAGLADEFKANSRRLRLLEAAKQLSRVRRGRERHLYEAAPTKRREGPQ
jgi:hypothetical protein